jgi:hypothetical protein
MKMLILSLSLALAALGGCAKSEGRPSRVTTTAARVTPGEAAIADISSALCNREQNCNNVGMGRRYPAYAECLRVFGHRSRETLRLDECRRGFSDTNVSTCLSDIRKESCASRLDTVDLVPACRRANLCR